MNKATLNIKTDPQIKKQIQEFASELGVPVSVIMNAQIKQMLRDRKIILSTELEPTAYLTKIMTQVEHDIAEKRNTTITNTSEDITAHLDSL